MVTRAKHLRGKISSKDLKHYLSIHKDSRTTIAIIDNFSQIIRTVAERCCRLVVQKGMTTL